MFVLDENNKNINTDYIEEEFFYSVLSFKVYNSPDFYFKKATHLESFSSPSIQLKIGQFGLVMPLHWWILCTDMETVESIPLSETMGRDYNVLCINPIDSFIPNFYKLKTKTIFPNTTWTIPPIEDKDLLVVPLGVIERNNTREENVNKGPICAIFSPNKIEISKQISDIW